jgi:hypothetical protein
MVAQEELQTQEIEAKIRENLMQQKTMRPQKIIGGRVSSKMQG